MPLIRIHGVYHKITHKEIARLKGFPEDFPRSVPNKSRMYRSLIYAPNIKVTEQVVRNLCVEPYINSEGDVQMKNWENMARFKQLFEKYRTVIPKKSLHLNGCRVIAVWLEKQCQIRKRICHYKISV